MYKKRSIRYWTNTSKGKIAFEQVSLSAIQIFRNGHYLCTVEPIELYLAIKEVLNR